MLYDYNQPQFVELISLALEEFTAMQEAKAKTATKDKQVYSWEVPTSRAHLQRTIQRTG